MSDKNDPVPSPAIEPSPLCRVRFLRNTVCEINGELRPVQKGEYGRFTTSFAIHLIHNEIAEPTAMIVGPAEI